MEDEATSGTSDGFAEAFTTHANYLAAFAYLAGFSLFRSDKEVLEELAASFDTSVTDRPRPDANLSDVMACLHRAWGTELLLQMNARYATEDEIIRLSNTWGTIQAYYAGYSAVQALSVAKGNSRVTTHPATQRQFVDLWIDRGINLAPWTYAYGPDGYSGSSGRVIDEHIQTWSTPDDNTSWDIVASAQMAKEPYCHSCGKDMKQLSKDYMTEIGRARRTMSMTFYSCLSVRLVISGWLTGKMVPSGSIWSRTARCVAR